MITAGDNNYPDGGADTVDENIGQYYHEFISPYVGAYGPGAGENAFFPALGNHDWHAPGAAPICATSNSRGTSATTTSAKGPCTSLPLTATSRSRTEPLSIPFKDQWLQGALMASTAPFQVVYMHHAPYSSSFHGSCPDMQWPFRQWGADLVVGAHDHVYERLVQDGIPYFVNGAGGHPSLYDFVNPIAGSQVRFNEDHGAMLVVATSQRMKLTFISRAGAVMDTYTAVPAVTTTGETNFVPAGSVWSYLDDGSDQGTAWKQPSFDDSAWAVGPAPLGYGNGGEATTVSYGGDPADKFITTYFRRSFLVGGASQYKRLRLRVTKDDGVRICLNGVGAARFNLPFGALPYQALAPYAVNGSEESDAIETYVDPRLLREGTNVLAVEVHQESPVSSDIRFDLELTGEF